MNYPRDPDLDWLLSESRIRKLIYQYCAAIDRAQLHLFSEIFHDDATIAIGRKDLPLSQFIDGLRRRQQQVLRGTHMLGNIIIDAVGPDHAFVESYGLALEQVCEADGKAVDRILRLRYADLVERRAGQWKIQRRMLILDHIMASVPALSDDLLAGRLGTRDESDPALQMRAAVMAAFARTPDA